MFKSKPKQPEQPVFIEHVTARTAHIRCHAWSEAGAHISTLPKLEQQSSVFKLPVGYEYITIPDACAVPYDSKYHLGNMVSIERCGDQFRVMPPENSQAEQMLIMLSMGHRCRIKFGHSSQTGEQVLFKSKMSSRCAEYLLLLKPDDEVQITTEYCYSDSRWSAVRNSWHQTISVSDDLTISINKMEVAESNWTTQETLSASPPAMKLTTSPRNEQTYSNHPVLAATQRKLMDELAQGNSNQRAENAITYLLPVIGALQGLEGAIRNNKSLELVSETLTCAEAHYATTLWGSEEQNTLSLVRDSFVYLLKVIEQWPNNGEPLHATELIKNMAGLMAQPIRNLGLGEFVTGVPFIEYNQALTA